MAPSVSSVHVPSAMNSISIRSGGKKKEYTVQEISEYASLKGIPFVDAFRCIVEKEFLDRKRAKQ